MTSSVAERTDHTAISSRRAGLPPSITLGLLGVTVVVTAVIALSVGRFSVPPVEIVRLLVGKIVPIEKTWYPQEETVVMDVRMPRILLSLVIGAGLSVGGATLQAVFRNPLVSPQVIGVSSGASFGGVIVLLFGLGQLHRFVIVARRAHREPSLAKSACEPLTERNAVIDQQQTLRLDRSRPANSAVNVVCTPAHLTLPRVKCTRSSQTWTV